MSAAWDWCDFDRAIRLSTHALGLIGIYIASEAGLEAMLLVGLILAGLAIFAGLVIGALWTNETVLSFILGLMNLFIAMVMYDGTLALFRPPRRPHDPAAYTSRIPLIRLLAYPLLSPVLALTTLALLHLGIEAIFPLATFAWVTTLLSRPGMYGNVTMRRTVLYIVGLSVVTPAVIFALIKTPSPFPVHRTSHAEPSPLKKLVPKESAPLSQWQAEFYSLSLQSNTPLLPGALISACLRYDWTRSLPAGITAERAFTGLSPWQISERARSRRTAPRPTFHAGLVGMAVGLIAFNGIEVFTSAETMKRALPLGMIFVPPFVVVAVCLSVWMRGEWKTWWAYKEDWESSVQVQSVGDGPVVKPAAESKSIAPADEKTGQAIA